MLRFAEYMASEKGRASPKFKFNLGSNIACFGGQKLLRTMDQISKIL